MARRICGALFLFIDNNYEGKIYFGYMICGGKWRYSPHILR